MSSACEAMAVGQIEAALLAERRIAGDDGSSDAEARHLVGDDLLGVGQLGCKLNAQSNQQRAKVFGSLGYVSVVIGKHGQSRLSLA